MVALLCDENFNNRILRGLLRLEPDLDILRVQDTEVAEADDPQILDFAFSEGRVLLTQDIKTIPDFYRQNIKDGKPNPGILIVKKSIPIKDAINELQMIAVCSELDEWLGKLFYLPL